MWSNRVQSSCVNFFLLLPPVCTCVSALLQLRILHWFGYISLRTTLCSRKVTVCSHLSHVVVTAAEGRECCEEAAPSAAGQLGVCNKTYEPTRHRDTDTTVPPQSAANAHTQTHTSVCSLLSFCVSFFTAAANLLEPSLLRG